MIQTTKLKKKFNNKGIQLPTKTVMVLDSEIERLVDRWVNNAKESNIRRLTPNECSRLQGFSWKNEDGTWDDSWNDIGISDTQRYKQLGNAVSIPVVKAIMEKLYAKEEKEEKVKTKHSHPTPG